MIKAAVHSLAADFIDAATEEAAAIENRTPQYTEAVCYLDEIHRKLRDVLTPEQADALDILMEVGTDVESLWGHIMFVQGMKAQAALDCILTDGNAAVEAYHSRGKAVREVCLLPECLRGDEKGCQR